LQQARDSFGRKIHHGHDTRVIEPRRTDHTEHTDDALQAYAYQVENYPDGLFRVDAEMQRFLTWFNDGAPLDWILKAALAQP